MNFTTKQEFDKLLAKDSYWKGRWEYTQEVINILKQEKFESALEIGSKELKIVKDSDLMDNMRDPYGQNPCKYTWSACSVPWPIKDKQYDILIALQVWEHLRNDQRKAFREVMRTCKMAILSFPYKWDVPNDPMHRWIDEKKIKDWTMGVKPVKIVPIINRRPNPKDERNRIIYFFKF